MQLASLLHLQWQALCETSTSWHLKSCHKIAAHAAGYVVGRPVAMVSGAQPLWHRDSHFGRQSWPVCLLLRPIPFGYAAAAAGELPC